MAGLPRWCSGEQAASSRGRLQRTERCTPPMPWRRAAPTGGTAGLRLRAAGLRSRRIPAGHVTAPGAELVAQRRLAQAFLGLNDLALGEVLAVVAMKAQPLGGLRLEAALDAVPVFQVVGIHHRGRRVDQVV